MNDVQQTLDKFKVPAAEQAELKEIVNSTYGGIVVGKANHLTIAIRVTFFCPLR